MTEETSNQGASEQARNLDKERSYWDRRATSFARVCGGSPYANEFIARLKLGGLAANASVFDMGSGPGTLALPLARQGHPVVACDISPKMLKRLSDRAEVERLDVQTIQVAWEDDWEEFGIAEKTFDVAIASRSIKKKRLPEMIAKMERVAREKVAITVPAGPAPFVDPCLMKALGRAIPENRNDMEVVSLLAEQGKYPEVSYLRHIRGIRFASREELEEDLLSMTGDEPLSDQEKGVVSRYTDKHIVEDATTDEDGNPKREFYLDYSLTVVWGLIVWRPDGTPIF